MYKILIVDDEEGIRRLVATTMKFADYHILQAASGDDAVQIAKKEMPDVILMDIDMPGNIDGLEATRQIRQDSSMRDIKIIILTSHDFESEKQRAASFGADDYFIKPFRPLELIKKVEKYLPDNET